jgi:hypothetical protein
MSSIPSKTRWNGNPRDEAELPLAECVELVNNQIRGLIEEIASPTSTDFLVQQLHKAWLREIGRESRIATSFSQEDGASTLYFSAYPMSGLYQPYHPLHRQEKVFQVPCLPGWVIAEIEDSPQFGSVRLVPGKDISRLNVIAGVMDLFPASVVRIHPKTTDETVGNPDWWTAWWVLSSEQQCLCFGSLKASVDLTDFYKREMTLQSLGSCPLPFVHESITKAGISATTAGVEIVWVIAGNRTEETSSKASYLPDQENPFSCSGKLAGAQPESATASSNPLCNAWTELLPKNSLYPAFAMCDRVAFSDGYLPVYPGRLFDIRIIAFQDEPETPSPLLAVRNGPYSNDKHNSSRASILIPFRQPESRHFIRLVRYWFIPALLLLVSLFIAVRKLTLLQTIRSPFSRRK